MKEFYYKKIKKDVLLKNYSTIAVGGKAKYFISVKNLKDLQFALIFAKKRKEKYFVLGNGSNSLFSDNGFNGLIIKIDIDFCILKFPNIFVGAGYSLAKLAKKTSFEKNFSGLEFATSIPATIGGAICMNASANNQSMSNIIEKILYVFEDGKICIIEKKDMQFSYRNSFCAKKKV